MNTAFAPDFLIEKRNVNIILLKAQLIQILIYQQERRQETTFREMQMCTNY